MITSWKELPIGLFQEIVGINRLQISDDEKTFMCTALLNGMDYDEFLSLPLAEATELIEKASFIYSEPKKVKVRRKYEIGGMVFKMMRNVNDMTAAQYINYQAIVNRPTSEIITNLMAIVLVPDGKVYGDYNEEDIIEILRENLNVEDALAIADFFINSFERLIRRTLRNSDAVMITAEIVSPKEAREMIKALRLEVRLIMEELRLEFGSH